MKLIVAKNVKVVCKLPPGRERRVLHYFHYIQSHRLLVDERERVIKSV